MAGLTQEQVAQRLGKPQSYISQCQSGERRMDSIEIHDFCRAIEIPLTDFVQHLEAAWELPERSS